MKNILFLFLIISNVAFGQTVNIKDFGAIANDTLDDTKAFNKAYQAVPNGGTITVPIGTFICNLASPSIYGSGSTSSCIPIDKWGVKKIKIVGETGAKITTNRTSGNIFYFFNQCMDCTVENIFFENTHPLTTAQTNAIYLTGLGSNNIRNFTIRDCRFEGFSTAILAQGVVSLKIINNIFEAPLGHDNAQDSEEPAVYVWFGDNSNGQCYDVNMNGNYASGFSGKNINSTATKRPTDGFVYGTVYGLNYQNNVTKNFGQEHILLSPNITYPNLNYSVLITNNQFNCAIPDSSKWKGLPLTSNYGVRADLNNVIVSDNNFYSFTQGVMIRPYDYPKAKGHSYTVSNNRFYSPRSYYYDVKNAINIQGATANQAYNIVVSNNVVDIDSISLKGNKSVIQVYDTEKLRIKNNDIFARNVIGNGFVLTGITIGRSTIDILNSGNTLSGLK